MSSVVWLQRLTKTSPLAKHLDYKASDGAILARCRNLISCATVVRSRKTDCESKS